MELKVGDFVIIVCEIPYGLCETDPGTPHVRGRLGVITEINEDKGYIDGVCFRVKDEKGDEFVYAKCELIPAFESDIRRVLRELLDGGKRTEGDLLTREQSEMDKLEAYLKENGYTYQRIREPKKAYGIFDQIRCGDWDAVCHNFSYGGREGLLETMGMPEDNGDVSGYMTAEDVISRLNGKCDTCYHNETEFSICQYCTGGDKYSERYS